MNILWIFSYPNYSSKIGFMIKHYVLEIFHAPFKFLPPQFQALIMTSLLHKYKTTKMRTLYSSISAIPLYKKSLTSGCMQETRNKNLRRQHSTMSLVNCQNYQPKVIKCQKKTMPINTSLPVGWGSTRRLINMRIAQKEIFAEGKLKRSYPKS